MSLDGGARVSSDPPRAAPRTAETTAVPTGSELDWDPEVEPISEETRSSSEAEDSETDQDKELIAHLDQGFELVRP